MEPELLGDELVDGLGVDDGVLDGVTAPSTASRGSRGGGCTTTPRRSSVDTSTNGVTVATWSTDPATLVTALMVPTGTPGTYGL